MIALQRDLIGRKTPFVKPEQLFSQQFKIHKVNGTQGTGMRWKLLYKPKPKPIRPRPISQTEKAAIFI